MLMVLLICIRCTYTLFFAFGFCRYGNVRSHFPTPRGVVRSICSRTSFDAKHYCRSAMVRRLRPRSKWPFPSKHKAFSFLPKGFSHKYLCNACYDEAKYYASVGSCGFCRQESTGVVCEACYYKMETKFLF